MKICTKFKFKKFWKRPLFDIRECAFNATQHRKFSVPVSAIFSGVMKYLKVKFTIVTFPTSSCLFYVPVHPIYSVVRIPLPWKLLYRMKKTKNKKQKNTWKSSALFCSICSDAIKCLKAKFATLIIRQQYLSFTPRKLLYTSGSVVRI